MEKEVIFAEDLERIFGPRAGAPKNGEVKEETTETAEVESNE